MQRILEVYEPLKKFDRPPFQLVNGSETVSAATKHDLLEVILEAAKKGITIQRYKGLGEMDADQLRETTMDPDHRTLRRITIKDAAAAEKMFELLMGNEVAPRKDFISNADIDRERIDA